MVRDSGVEPSVISCEGVFGVASDLMVTKTLLRSVGGKGFIPNRIERTPKLEVKAWAVGS
jgi:hypothetical protein